MALVGNLRDLKLPNLIQLNCMERNTAKLTIEHAGKYGIVYFHDGQIVHAEYDPDIGEKALYRLLVLSEGNFKVENGVRPPLITINTHWNNLLLEGLHQLGVLVLADVLGRTIDNENRRYSHAAALCDLVYCECVAHVEQGLLPTATRIPEVPFLISVNDSGFPVTWVDDYLVFR